MITGTRDVVRTVRQQQSRRSSRMFFWIGLIAVTAWKFRWNAETRVPDSCATSSTRVSLSRIHRTAV
jgi:hypothetical protein